MSNKLLCAKKRRNEVSSCQVSQLDSNSQCTTEKVPANWGGGRVNTSKKGLNFFFIHLISNMSLGTV